MVKLTKLEKEKLKRQQSRLFVDVETKPDKNNAFPTNSVLEILPANLTSHLKNYKPLTDGEKLEANTQYKPETLPRVTINKEIPEIYEIARLRASRNKINPNVEKSNVKTTEIKVNLNIQNNLTNNLTNNITSHQSFNQYTIKNIFTEITNFVKINIGKNKCKFCNDEITEDNLAILLKDFFVCKKPSCIYEAVGILDKSISEVNALEEENLAK